MNRAHSSRDTRPRLLVISPVFPYPLIAGGRIRIYHILKRLAQHYRITLLAQVEDIDDTPGNRQALSFINELALVRVQQKKTNQILRLAFNIVSWLKGVPLEVLAKKSTAFMQRLKALLEQNEYSAALVEYTQCIQYMSPIRKKNIPAVLVAHDISFISMERRAQVAAGIWKWLWTEETRKMRVYEMQGWRLFSRIMAMSETDKNALIAELPSAKVDVIPNGVDVNELLPIEEGDVPTLVFVGWMRHLPNRDAVAWFIDSIWPLVKRVNPDVRFLIIGRNLPKPVLEKVADDPRVEYPGHVENIAEPVGRAWISVVPIRVGSGSRLKILESMALGTPVVTTTVGCEGISATNHKDVEMADTAEEFAAEIIHLLENKEKRRHLAENARKLVEEKYAWDTIGRLADESIKKAVNLPT